MLRITNNQFWAWGENAASEEIDAALDVGLPVYGHTWGKRRARMLGDHLKIPPPPQGAFQPPEGSLRLGDLPSLAFAVPSNSAKSWSLFYEELRHKAERALHVPTRAMRERR